MHSKSGFRSTNRYAAEESSADINRLSVKWDFILVR